MIIWGFRASTKKLATLLLVCSRCGNPAEHRVLQRRRWLILFFVPVLPVSSTRSMVCGSCGTTSSIDREEARRLVASFDAPTPPSPAGSAPVVDPAPSPGPPMTPDGKPRPRPGPGDGSQAQAGE